MSCSTCYTDNYNKYYTTGRVITGRSTPGNPQNGLPKSNPGGTSTQRRYGIPKTDAERQATHYARYGTTNLPVRGTGLGGTQKMALEWNLPMFVIGGIVGFVFAAFVLTPTGRGVGEAAGRRTARKIRG